jgi:hypothetical protein
MTDAIEALSLMKQALIIMDRMDLALPVAHLSMSIAALEELDFNKADRCSPLTHMDKV